MEIEIKKPQTVEEVLSVINTFFAEHPYDTSLTMQSQSRYKEGLRLWSILSALRGPDSGHYALKEATTYPIRFAAIPAINNFVHCERDNPGFERFRNQGLGVLTVQIHFMEHAKDAFKALGLDW